MPLPHLKFFLATTSDQTTLRNRHVQRGQRTETNRDLSEVFRTQNDQIKNQAQRIATLESVSASRVRLYSLSTPLEIKQTAAETEYASLVIPRNLIGKNGIMIIITELICYNPTASPNNVILRATYGGQTSAIGPFEIAAMASTTNFRVCRLITKLIGNGTETAQRILHSLTVSNTSEDLTGSNVIEAERMDTLTVNSDIDQLLQLTIQHSDDTVLFKTIRNMVEFGFPIAAG